MSDKNALDLDEKQNFRKQEGTHNLNSKLNFYLLHSLKTSKISKTKKNIILIVSFVI